MSIHRSTIFVLLVSAMFASVSLATAPNIPMARVSQGELAGLRQGSVEAFLGIPYAAPLWAQIGGVRRRRRLPGTVYGRRIVLVRAATKSLHRMALVPGHGNT